MILRFIIQADNLSQRPDHAEDQEEDEEMVVLPENLFVDLIDIELADWIKEETLKDSNYVKLNQDKKAEKSIWDSKEVVISKGNIFINGKQYIPDNIALKREIMKSYMALYHQVTQEN